MPASCSLVLAALASQGLLVASLVFAPAPIEPAPLPPGGYYKVGQVPETPPPDGRRATLSGSIIFPLGTLRMALGFVQLELVKPGRCQFTPESCRGLKTYGLIGVSFGAALAVTGLAFLGVGLARRSRLRRWKAARNLAWRVDPQLADDGAGLRLFVSF